MSTSLLQRQIGRARRRLFFRSLLNTCNGCWAGGLLLAAGWFLLQPQVLGSQPEWLRWAVVGGLLGLATLLGVVIALLRAPSPLDVALLIDQKFGLKERVTTSLLLDPAASGSPAGQALLADVNGRVGKLDLAAGFPLAGDESRWALAGKALLVPLAALALVLVVLLYHPADVKADPTPTAEKEMKPDEAAQVKKNIQDIIKKPTETKPGEPPREKSALMKKIDEDYDKLLNKPAQTKEHLKDLAKGLSGLEQNLKNHEKDLAARQAALQQQLKKLDQMTRDANNDGPAKQMQKALTQGDFDKAKQEAEDLARKLKDGKLDEKEKQELTRQVKDLEDKLNELKRQKDDELKKERDNIARQLERGDIDKKTADQLQKDLDKKADGSKDLDQLADQLKQCQQCLKDGDGDKAADALQKAADQLKQMAGDKKDLKDLQDRLDDLKKAQQALAPSVQGGKPVPGAGQRPETKEGTHKSQESTVSLPEDPRGRKQITDFVTGPAFKKKSSQEIAAEVVQSSQEADAAREQQKVDRAAKDIYKGYFENLRKDAEKNLPKAPNP
jgi:hypothetical protein